MLSFTAHWARLSQLLSKGQSWLRSKEVFCFLAFVSLCCLIACTHSSVAEKAEFYYKKGQSLASHGNQKEAVENFELSLNLSEQIDFQAGVAHNLNELAILQTDQGKCAVAREFLARALNIYRQLDMQPEISKTLYNIALTYLRENNYDKALEQFNELLDWDRRTGNQLGEAITLYNTAIIYKNYLHQPDEADRLFSEALSMLEDLKQK